MGLTDREREMLEYVSEHGGHSMSGWRSGRAATLAEAATLDALSDRDLVVAVDCPDPCPYSHSYVTSLGLYVLELDAMARGQVAA